jgi:hypothetical protein
MSRGQALPKCCMHQGQIDRRADGRLTGRPEHATPRHGASRRTAAATARTAPRELMRCHLPG